VGLKVLGAGEELLLVSEKGVIVRTQADAVPQQSRAATGVRLQKLDARDRLSEVVLVPPAAEEEEVPVDGEVVALEEAVALTTEDAGASPAELESPASEG
jgi:DNA gyrase subunit A